jgi:hypothetical protein
MACQTRFSPFWLSTALDQTFLKVFVVPLDDENELVSIVSDASVQLFGGTHGNNAILLDIVFMGETATKYFVNIVLGQ